MSRLFLDSSVLFSAIYSSAGAARELLRLALRGEVHLILSHDVVTETRRNLGRKAPELVPLMERLLLQIPFEVAANPLKEEVWAAEAYVNPKDALIIAAAIQARPDYLTTLDRKHLIDPPEVAERSGLTILTPGDALRKLRG
ncbi:MAG: PIN domain-containing protein [Candidatus Promineifilaceae bacterium]